MQILETIKSHPVYIIGAIGVVFVGYIYFSSGGSGGDTSGGSSGDIYAAQNAAGDQLQLASLQAQSQDAAIGAGLQATQIQAQNQLDIANIGKDVAITQLNTQSASTDLANVLTANVAMKNIQAGVDINANNNYASVSNTQTVASALVSQAQINSNVALASINASASTNQAYIAANKKQCGLLGSIFGC